MAEDLAHLRTEMSWLRHDIRLFTAMSNADVKWFAGSKSLQYYSAKGVLDSILMAVRRLNDQGRPRGVQGVEEGLESLYANLVRRGAQAVADQLRDMDQHQHVRHQADKRLAHAKPGDLLGESEFYPGLGKGDVHLAMLAQVVDAMSKAYTSHIEPGMHLDLINYDEDTWDRAVRKDGLPVVDFSPLDIFVEYTDLASSLRNVHLRRAADAALRGEVPAHLVTSATQPPEEPWDHSRAARGRR